MKTTLTTLVALAAIASCAARADEADASQYVLKFEGNRTRAEVMAEAATIAATHGIEPAGSRVAPLPKSSLDAKAVRAQAAEAVRLGQTSSGEASRF